MNIFINFHFAKILAQNVAKIGPKMARNRAPEHPRSCRRAYLGQKNTPEPIPRSKRPVVGPAGPIWSIFGEMEIYIFFQFLLLPWFFASRVKAPGFEIAQFRKTPSKPGRPA